MRFDLNDDQREIRDTARALLERRSPPDRVREAAEARSEDESLWAEVAELGWPGIAVPESEGGLGLGLVELCVMLEEVGAVLAPIPLLTSACAAQVIARGGSGAQRERWLPSLVDGSAKAGIGMADGQGPAAWAAGCVGADLAVILDGDGARLVEASEMDLAVFEAIDPLRSYGTTAAPGERLPGDVERGRQEAVVAVAAELLGVARRALEMSVSYAKERRQFGAPVGSFQAVAHRCAEMLLAVESARSAVYSAAWAAEGDPPRLAEAAALAKLLASEAAVEVTGASIQVHGGIGFTWEADIHWWYKRAQLDAQLLGGSGVHRRDLGALLAERFRSDSPTRANG